MKFLTIGGKLQKDANGKVIVVPDSYDNNLLKLGGKLLKHNGKLIGGNNSAQTMVTFYISCNDDYFAVDEGGTYDSTETYTAPVGSTLGDAAQDSGILSMLGIDSVANIYGFTTTIDDVNTRFTLNGSSSIDDALNGALGPDDVIDSTWDGQTFWVVRAQ